MTHSTHRRSKRDNISSKSIFKMEHYVAILTSAVPERVSLGTYWYAVPVICDFIMLVEHD